MIEKQEHKKGTIMPKNNIEKTIQKHMSHNPYFQKSLDNIEKDPIKAETYAKLAQVYEQNLRNRMAYLTASKRNIASKELDEIFDND